MLSYKHKLHPPHTHSRLLPEGFYDWDEGEGLKTVTSSHNLLKTEDYNNGLLVIRSDVQAETKRYNKLKGTCPVYVRCSLPIKVKVDSLCYMHFVSYIGSHCNVCTCVCVCVSVHASH